MAEYHVGCGLFDIYAGTLKNEGKKGVNEWRSKSEVTNEALDAVKKMGTYVDFVNNIVFGGADMRETE